MANKHQHIIQYFKPSQENWKDFEVNKLVGVWQNTAWGSDDEKESIATAKDVMATGKYAGVRVLEVIHQQMYQGE